MSFSNHSRRAGVNARHGSCDFLVGNSNGQANVLGSQMVVAELVKELLAGPTWSWVSSWTEEYGANDTHIAPLYMVEPGMLAWKRVVSEDGQVLEPASSTAFCE